MKEEDNIRKKIGTENPFKVPEGYFDTVVADVMSRLPEKEETTEEPQRQPTTWQRIKPWLYMAAMFAGAAMIIRVAQSDPTIKENRTAIDETEAEVAYINAMVDNSMLDDYSLYVYLTENDAD